MENLSFCLLQMKDYTNCDWVLQPKQQEWLLLYSLVGQVPRWSLDLMALMRLAQMVLTAE